MTHGRLSVGCVLAALMWLSVAVVPAFAQSPPVQAEVVRVIDGDTIQVRIGKVTQLVRYIGIDTPETVHPTRGAEPYGEAAMAANRALIEGQTVTLVFDDRDPLEHRRTLEHLEERRPIHLRHPEVQQDQIGDDGAGEVERVAAVAGGDDAVPRAREHDSPELANGVIVVRDEDPLRNETGPDDGILGRPRMKRFLEHRPTCWPG